jgi:CheY-like chemotaxis protein
MIGYNILPIGFSSYEKSTIETFFRLAGRRAPHWGLTSRSSEARVVLMNVSSKQDVESYRSLVASWQKVIIVGLSDYGTGWKVLPRPIKLTGILVLLDEFAKSYSDADALAAAPSVLEASQVTIAPAKTYPTTTKATNATPTNSNPSDLMATYFADEVKALTAPVSRAIQSSVSSLAASTPAAAFVKPNMTDVFANITSAAEPVPSLQSASLAADKSTTAKPALVPLNEAPSFNFYKDKAELNSNNNKANAVEKSESSKGVGRVLLVDDSDIALKHMQNRLRHFGYACDLVRSGEEALAKVSTHNYHFVFLDVMMAGLDGYQTCKAIKNNKARRGPAPVVVMLTSRGSTIDKIRGTMAGCDAYLTKPLNDKRMASVLAKFDESTATQRWEAVNPPEKLVDSFASK